jgi:hypothetical protein
VAQTIEYKGFGGEKAREMARRAFASVAERPNPQRTVPASHYD